MLIGWGWELCSVLGCTGGVMALSRSLHQGQAVPGPSLGVVFLPVQQGHLFGAGTWSPGTSGAVAVVTSSVHQLVLCCFLCPGISLEWPNAITPFPLSFTCNRVKEELPDLTPCAITSQPIPLPLIPSVVTFLLLFPTLNSAFWLDISNTCPFLPFLFRL